VTLLVASVLSLPLLAWWLSRQPKHDLADIYVCGRGVDAAHVLVGFDGRKKALSLRNYYLDGFVDGGRGFLAGTVLCAVVVAGTVVWGFFGLLGGGA